MSDIAASIADAPSTSAPASGGPSTSTPAESTPNTGADAQASTPASPDLPPGWSKRADGKWAWKGLVDGQETELDQERAESFLRTKESAQRRWQEAARFRQEAEQREQQLEEYLESIKTPQGIRQLARDLNMSPRQVAEAILAEELADEAMSPEERELRELRARDAHHTRAEQQRAQAEREQQIRAHEQQFVQRFTKATSESLDRIGAPANDGARKWITARVAQLYTDHKQNGEGVVTVDDLSKRAMGEYRDMAAGAFGDDDLMERVWSNEQLREKMRARYLEAARAPAKPQPKPGPGDLPPRREDGKFTKVRIQTDVAPSSFSSQLDELVRRKGGG